MKKALSEIRAELEQAPETERGRLLELYAEDERKGVRNLIGRYRKITEELQRERDRVEKLCEYEKRYAQYGSICGIDEVGRGPLAGPVVAGAVILPKDCRILYINLRSSAGKSGRSCILLSWKGQLPSESATFHLRVLTR